MATVLALALVLWFGGRLIGASRQVRLILAALLLVVVTSGHLVLPDDSGLRAATGGSAAPWMFLGVTAAAVGGYSAALGRVRERAQARTAAAPAEASGSFRPAELERYARHIMLREVGGPGQRRLREARVLVIGAGGLGSPALLYLAAAGVGRIGVIDDDTVDASNLQRQVIHTEDRIGMPKVFSAQMQMQALNPFVTVLPYRRRLTEDISADLFADFDLVLDGTDNFDTRYLANRAAVAAGIPLVAAAITQWEGQLSVWHPKAGTPCYECVFPERPAPGMVPTCAEAGVIAPLPGVLGAMMAVEALKVITGAGEPLRGRLMIHDALFAETRTIAVRPRPGCPVCGASGG